MHGALFYIWIEIAHSITMFSGLKPISQYLQTCRAANRFWYWSAFQGRKESV